MHDNILITGASGFIATYLNLLRPKGLKIFLSSQKNALTNAKEENGEDITGLLT